MPDLLKMLFQKEDIAGAQLTMIVPKASAALAWISDSLGAASTIHLRCNDCAHRVPKRVVHTECFDPKGK